MMQSFDYENIGEKLYSATLPNGLRLRVIPKPGFGITRMRRPLGRLAS